MGFFYLYFYHMDTIKALYKLFKEYKVVFTDSRKAKNGGIFFALKGDRFDANDFAIQALKEGANLAVVDRKELENTPGCFYVEDTLKALQQLANYHRNQLEIPFVAVTGTNGKTTTKELITSVLGMKYNVLATSGNFNNHIGVPLTLLSVNEAHEIAVIEMGANHPGEIDFLCRIAEPDFGLITNVGKAHLEGFGSFEGVKQTKSELYRFVAGKGKGLFLNLGNQHLVELVPDGTKTMTYAMVGIDADLNGELANDDIYVNARVSFEKGWLYINSKLTGAYNLENILAACRIGLYFDIDPLKIKEGIETYLPSNNRSQVVRRNSNVFIVDCYNANPSSMEVAVKNFNQQKGKNKILVLGDMLELGADATFEHQKLVDAIQRIDVDQVYLIGPAFSETNVPEGFRRYLAVNDFINTGIYKNWKESLVLVKGSRGIQLEKIMA